MLLPALNGISQPLHQTICLVALIIPEGRGWGQVTTFDNGDRLEGPTRKTREGRERIVKNGDLTPLTRAIVSPRLKILN